MWGVLREAQGELDTENNRFRMMWDATNLYILYQTDFNMWTTEADAANMNPDISFSPDNLNLYFDPNRDGEQNAVPDAEVDGYQLAFNQYTNPAGGALISTNANRQGVGFFTEAHNNNGFGDQANWNRGGSQVGGAALQDIVVAKPNNAAGGVAEIVFPWANFNADAFVAGTVSEGDFDANGLVDGDDFLAWQRGLGLTGEMNPANGDANADMTVDGADLSIWKTNFGANTQVPTGLNRVEGPQNNETWFFNMSRINGLGDAGNFLPIWNWQPAQSFTFHPHGEITFTGRPGEAPVAAAVPEPAALSLIGAAAIAALGSRRRSR
jgi:hypothetical protein